MGRSTSSARGRWTAIPCSAAAVAVAAVLRFGRGSLGSAALSWLVVVLGCLLGGSAAGRELPPGGAPDAGAESLDASAEGGGAAELPLCEARLSLCSAPPVALTAHAVHVPEPPRRVSRAGSLEDDSAPMCDREARSIGGDIEIAEIDQGHFEVLPCETVWLLLMTSAQGERDPGHARAAVDEDPRPALRLGGGAPRELLGVAPFVVFRHAEAVLLPPSFAAGLGECSGHSPGIYRPPSV